MSGVSDPLGMESVLFQCRLAILATSCRPAFHIASCPEFRFWFLMAELSPTLSLYCPPHSPSSSLVSVPLSLSHAGETWPPAPWPCGKR